MSQVFLPALNLKWDYSIATHIIERLPASETRDFRGMGLLLDYISLDSETSNSAEGFFLSLFLRKVYFSCPTNPQEFVRIINIYHGE